MEVDKQRLRRQILELGQYKPLLVTDEGIVIGGNKRMEVYIESGVDKVWVSLIEFKKEGDSWHAYIDGVKQRREFKSKEQGMVEYALSDNDRMGYYMGDRLSSLIAKYPEMPLSTYKVDMKPSRTLKDLVGEYRAKSAREDSFAGEAVKRVTKGDIWRLGRHKLMCGDATRKGDIERLMDGKKADMVFTDPPYGKLKVGTGIGERNVAPVSIYKQYVADGNFDFTPTWEIINKWDCKKLIWGGNYFASLLPITTSWIVWDKRAGKHSWFSDCELAWTNFGIPARLYDHVWQGMIRAGESSKKLHPTQKPVRLIAQIMNDNNAGKNVVDLFGGSGSTLIACEQTDRTCYMMEIDPHYCDVIIQRWENLTHLEAKKIT